MPLELITGPANSAKAKHVLDAYRDTLARDPVLVVPRSADVEHYRRELARSGAIFGVRVLRFAGLIGEIARRVELGGQPITDSSRQRIASLAAARTPLSVLSASAPTPGFASALAHWFAELEARRVQPPRLDQALKAWTEQSPGQREYAAELGALYRAYRGTLDRLGRLDRELYAVAALNAVSVAPAAWGSTPVFVYGFDDFTVIELDAIETLARVVQAPVTVSLPYEPGRPAFAGRAEAFARLRELADEHVTLPARADYYAGPSARALHHLERALFGAAGWQDDAGSDGPGGSPDPVDPGSPDPVEPGSPNPVEPGSAVRLLESPSQRAELELVSDEIAGLLAGGMRPEDVAVVMRPTHEQTWLVEEAFARRGIPIARESHEGFGQTALGGGLLSLLRCALLEGSSGDLLSWLRTPGVLEIPELADRLERSLRREGVETAAAARAVWERDRWPLEAIDRLVSGRAQGPVALVRQLGRELEGLFAASRRRRAALLTTLELPDAAALSAGRSALSELAELASADPALGEDPAELERMLRNLSVPIADGSQPGVLIADPLSLRARRVRALFVCGLQAGTFPAPAPADPFLSDEQRRDIARASGLVLASPGAHSEVERFLFYAVVSRPEELLVLSWHTADEEGVPCLRSLYVDDVADVFAGEIPVHRTESGDPAPAAGIVSAPAIGALGSPAVLAELTGRPAWSASSLELWAGCPVRWFVERFLNPEDLDPEAEALRRGGVAHSVLEETLAELGRQTGSSMLTPDRLPLARELMAGILHAHARARPITAEPLRRRVLVRRLQADLERYLVHAAASRTVFEPRHLELEFGMTEAGEDAAPERAASDGEEAVLAHEAPEAQPALVLAGDGEPELRLRGRIDRVDVDSAGTRAIVYDYKGRAAFGGRRWGEEGLLQIPLYMLAVRQLLGLEPVGGFYQPLAGGDPRARGAVLAEADPDLDSVASDRFTPEELDALIEDAVTRARRAVGEARAGQLRPRPHSCSPRGGCSYPVLCRCEVL
jgi:ATP-dependent helicase/DNAse subunit B